MNRKGNRLFGKISRHLNNTKSLIRLNSFDLKESITHPSPKTLHWSEWVRDVLCYAIMLFGKFLLFCFCFHN